MNTLVDNFEGTTIDGSRYITSGTVAVHNHSVSLNGSLTTRYTYNLIDAGVFAKIQIPSTAIEPVAFQILTSLGQLAFIIVGDELICRVQIDHINSDTTTLYNSVSQLWLQIRDSAGIAYWETSPDGRAWTIVRSGLHGLNLQASTFKVEHSVSASGSAFGTGPFGITSFGGGL